MAQDAAIYELEGARAIRELYGEDHLWVSPWIASLPARYFREYDAVLRDHFFSGAAADSAIARRHVQLYSFVRMSHSRMDFLPWLTHALPLEGKRVLEIGCGSGSSTAALLFAGADVHAIDIEAGSPRLARERIRLVGAPDRATFDVVSPNWLANDDAFAWSDVRADVIVGYALLEHLTIPERFTFLRNAMKALPVGGHLVIYETPNRLAPVDWHSTSLPFSEILPDDLAQINLRRSPRADLPKDAARDVTALYRWGRGVSFHEFDLAIGLSNFRIVQDGAEVPERFNPQTPRIHDDLRRSYSKALGDMLEALSVPRAFAYTSLDLVLQKL